MTRSLLILAVLLTVALPCEAGRGRRQLRAARIDVRRIEATNGVALAKWQCRTQRAKAVAVMGGWFSPLRWLGLM